MNGFPFDSQITGYDADGLPQYDRASNAEEFARLLAAFLCDGVFAQDMCAVTAGVGMTATVGAGACMIQGRYGYAAAAESVTFVGAEASPRIDTVALRLNLATSARGIYPCVVKGTASASPVRPALTRDATVWELGLADVLIPANSSAIAQSRITDTRLETARCGIVAAILSAVDPTTFYNQIQAALDEFKAAEMADFASWSNGQEQAVAAWFADLQATLDSNAAANMMGKINAFTGDKITNAEIDAALEG